MFEVKKATELMRKKYSDTYSMGKLVSPIPGAARLKYSDLLYTVRPAAVGAAKKRMLDSLMPAGELPKKDNSLPI